MTEEGVDAGGKVGVSRKLVVGVVIALLLIAGAGAILSLKENDPIDDDIPMKGILYLDTRDMGNVWYVKIVDIKSIGAMELLQEYLNESRLCYQLSQRQNNYQDNEYGYLKDIKTTPSPLGVTWVNLDNESVEVGDYFIIDKTGGSGGKAEPHDKFQILPGLFETNNNWVYLPPAEFLDMDVVKTATGWNMTVTWVNETVPGGFMSGDNVSFRVEDINGDYFGERPGVYIGDISPVPKEYWRTALRLIDNSIRNLSDSHHNYYYDQGAYNISWFDNDMNNLLSIGDVILIENYSGLVEHGYSFRLLCKNYGWMHTIHNLTLSR